MSWLQKIAVEEHKWYNLDDPLITLYHATSSLLWPKIKIEGLKPPNVQNIVDEVIVSAGFSPDEIPNWVKSELDLRRDPKVHWGMSPRLAEGYATYVGAGGEIAYSTYWKIEAWAKENGLEGRLKPRPKSATVMIRGDIPREMAQRPGYGREFKSLNDYFRFILGRLQERGNEHNKETILDTAEIITGPVPPQYLNLHSVS